jgi:hypothetical protein
VQQSTAASLHLGWIDSNLDFSALFRQYQAYSERFASLMAMLKMNPLLT